MSSGSIGGYAVTGIGRLRVTACPANVRPVATQFVCGRAGTHPPRL